MQTRQNPRKVIALPARYSASLGKAIDVEVTDISPGGCRFAASGRPLSKGTPLQITIAGFGPIQSKVTWSKDGNIGVTFAKELTQSQVEQLQNGVAPTDAPDAKSGDDNSPQGPSAPNRFC